MEAVSNVLSHDLAKGLFDHEAHVLKTILSCLWNTRLIPVLILTHHFPTLLLFSSNSFGNMRKKIYLHSHMQKQKNRTTLGIHDINYVLEEKGECWCPSILWVLDTTVVAYIALFLNTETQFYTKVIAQHWYTEWLKSISDFGRVYVLQLRSPK